MSDSTQEQALVAYLAEIFKLHPDWDDVKKLTIARMALSKALYGVTYNPEIESIISSINDSILSSSSQKKKKTKKTAT